MIRLAKLFTLLLFLLCLGAAVCFGQWPPIARIAATLPPPPTKTVYISATAYDVNGTESDFAPELVFSYTTNSTVTIAWDASTTPSVTGYTVYWGTNSGEWLSWANAGNALQFAVPLVPPQTNYGAVFAQSSTNYAGPFLDLSTTPLYRFTNINGYAQPPGQQYFRLRIQQGTMPIP